MKLTMKRAEELRKKGVKVDMTQVVSSPEPVKKEPVKVVLDKPDDNMVIIKDLVQIVKANEQNVASLAQIQADLVKPKSPKKWACVIGRNSRGEMSTVDINEIQEV